MTVRRAYVYEAELELAPGADTRAPGGAITVALCGHWVHDGPCRWPHYSGIDTDRAPARLCTVFACPEDEVAEVHAAIDRAVRTAAGWIVVSSQRRDPHGDEVDLGARLAHDDGEVVD